MGGKGNMKGKGSGKNSGKNTEGFDEKTKRLEKEVRQASDNQDADGLAYLWKVQGKHLNSSNWWPSQQTFGKSKGKAKPRRNRRRFGL